MYKGILWLAPVRETSIGREHVQVIPFFFVVWDMPCKVGRRLDQMTFQLNLRDFQTNYHHLLLIVRVCGRVPWAKESLWPKKPYYKLLQWHQSLITILLKPGKDTDDCGSYRLVSLLNADYKILA